MGWEGIGKYHFCEGEEGGGGAVDINEGYICCCCEIFGLSGCVLL